MKIKSSNDMTSFSTPSSSSLAPFRLPPQDPSTKFQKVYTGESRALYLPILGEREEVERKGGRFLELPIEELMKKADKFFKPLIHFLYRWIM